MEKNIIKNPLQSEKSIRLMEAENTLVFAVEKKATKDDVKKAVEQLFKVKVENVHTFITPHGEKRAYVRLIKENPAIDIATQLGMM